MIDASANVAPLQEAAAPDEVRRPWWPADPAAWSVVLELLPRPLLAEAVLLDLSYLENEHRRGRSFPSLRELQARWGWSRRKVDGALAGAFGDWHCPRRPVALEVLRAGRVRGASLAVRNGAAAAPVSGVGTRVGTQPSTSRTEQPGPIGESGHASGHASGHVEISKQASTADDRGHTTRQPDKEEQQQRPADASLCEGEVEPVVDELLERPAEPPKGSRAQQLVDASRALYATWRERHPRADEHPSRDRARLLRAAIGATAAALAGPGRTPTPEHWRESLQRLELLVAWHHTAPAAAWYQADPTRLGLDYVLRASGLSDRIDRARTWHDEGRPENVAAATVQYEPEAEKAWTHVQKLMAAHGARLLQRWTHPDPVKHAAFVAAIDELGGPSALCQATTWQLEKELGPRFVAAYTQQRASAQGG